MTKSKTNKNMPKDLNDHQKERWELEHSENYIVTIYAGGEHRRAGKLAAEAGYDGDELDELDAKAPGIREHLPSDGETIRDKGSIAGDPVKEAVLKNPYITEETAQEFGVDVPAPGNPLDHDQDGKSGGHFDNRAKVASNKGTQDTETLKK